MDTQIVIHDPELLQWHDCLWAQHYAQIDRDHPAYETVQAIKRVTGEEVVVFDTSHPDFSWDVVHAYIRENWWGAK